MNAAAVCFAIACIGLICLASYVFPPAQAASGVCALGAAVGGAG